MSIRLSANLLIFMVEVYNKSKRIAKNTFLLYMRMVIVMVITIYTVRVVIDTLGLEDYGVYNVVAGVIILLNCLNRVLSSATQRFYSYSIGINDVNYTRSVFSISINIYIIISIIVIVLGETIGLWFVNNQLVIPLDRLVAANWVYQFSIFSFISTIICVPFSAMVIAHEDMNLYAVMSLIECVLKLVSALLLYIVSYDNLVLYGCFLFMAHFIVFVLYGIVCYRKYQECSYQKIHDKNLFGEMLSFSGWTLFGSIAGVANQQGNTILVNIFFGPIVNAARAVSLQISSALDTFCSSFILAVQPPMIKSYAEGDMDYLMKLFYFSNKFIFYCMLVICLPCISEMETILNLWLVSYSQDMVAFSKLTLIYTMIVTLHNPVTIIMRATGNVKRYFVSVESFTLLSMPLTLLFFYLDYPAISTFIIMIIVFSLAHIIRLIILKNTIDLFSIKKYFISFVLPALMVTFVTFVAIFLLRESIKPGWLRLLLIGFVSTLLIAIQFVLFGLSSDERCMIKNIKK